MEHLKRLGLPMLALVTVLSAGLTAHAFAQVPPDATQTCTNSSSSGVFIRSGQASCQVRAPESLSSGETIFAMLDTYAGISPSQCLGLTTPGFTTQGSVSALPVGLKPGVAAANGCAFEVTTGAVAAGAPVGTDVIPLPYTTTSENWQLTLWLCSEHTCSALTATPSPAPAAP